MKDNRHRETRELDKPVIREREGRRRSHDLICTKGRRTNQIESPILRSCLTDDSGGYTGSCWPRCSPQMAATGESVRPVDYDEELALGSTWKSLRVQHLLYVVVGESAAYRIYQGKIAGDILRRQIVRGDIDHVRAFIYRFPERVDN